ncbi:MAG: Ryanodine receptor Ryr [Tissierellia bacterium]|nr:Ryanodine receptor Ryr [Tissierellia bacterium]
MDGLKIVVAGDVSVDRYYWPRVKSSNDEDINWKLYDGISTEKQPGGAVLLAEMIKCILQSKEISRNSVISQDCKNLIQKNSNEMLHTGVKLDLFPSFDSNGEKKEAKIYRVKKYLGYATPKDNIKYPRPLKIIDDDINASIVVLHDAGNSFRNDKDAWPEAIKRDKTPIVVYNMYPPLFNGDLWNHLLKHHKENIILILNVDDLRKLGANISRSISWEKSAMELLWEINNNEKLDKIKELTNVIIRFKFEGAVHYKGKNSRSNLYFDPVSIEGGWDSNKFGKMRAGTLVFVAVLSSLLFYKLDGNNDYKVQIGSSIRNSLIKSHEFLLNGYGNYNNNPSFKQTYLNLFNENDRDSCNNDPSSDKDNSLISKSLKSSASLIQCVTLPQIDGAIRPDPSFWTILGGKTEKECAGRREKPIDLGELAKKIVKDGLFTLKDFPVGKFGKLITVDRAEIESFRSIMNIMREYVYSENKQRPLSIAVFGSPGSGKSFGITEVAESIDSKRIEKVVFNISQFTYTRDLASAFHKVRDISLKGKIPLVFFDEFDSKFEGENLGWIKYFLVPMQDGEFMDCDNMHPIGKSIFVFAGGVYYTYDDFYNYCCLCTNHDKSPEKNSCKDVSNKCPDFLSRLRGYVNILGPNETRVYDEAYKIRRAILLRSLIEMSTPNIIDSDGNLHIDDKLLNALINAPRYIHGVRSMQAIVDMSMLREGDSWQKASLPPKDQLKLHIDKIDVFYRILDSVAN